MSFLSATLLIPACAIGAGLLSFPVLTGLSGLFPSSINIVLCWLFTTVSGLMILELTYLLKEQKKTDIHFFSINEYFLPKPLQWLSLFIFIFMCYASLIAYSDAIGPTISAFFDFGIEKKNIGLFGLTIIGCLMLLSKKMLCKINNIFTPGMLLSYLVLLAYGVYSYDNATAFAHSDLSQMTNSLPIIIAAFSYAFVIPSMVSILQSPKKVAKYSIICGTSLNCIIYLLWNASVLGSLPLHALQQAYQAGAPVTSVFQNNTLLLIGNIFALFALFTSFISISLSIMDYWKDHLKHNNQGMIWALIFIPVTSVFLLFDKLFLWIFSITGGYGDSILFGFLPAYMIYVAKKKHKDFYYSNVILIGVCLFAGLILGVQIKLDFSHFW